MLVSRHRIGKDLPEVVHPDADPVAVAVCREVLADTGAECVVLHGSRGWGGWDEQSDFNVIVVHEAASEKSEADRLMWAVLRAKNAHYQDSPEYQADLEDWPCILTPERYAALRRTLNHRVARAARRGLIFPRDSGAEDRYRHDGDTSNEWELVTLERLRMARADARSARDEQEWGRDRRYSQSRARLAGMTAHILLWQSGAALLSILGVIYPMRSTVEIARLIQEHDQGWCHQFLSDLSQLEQYAGCGCELVVTDRFGTCRSCGRTWRRTGRRCGPVSGS
jgi:hypothetical protein